MDEIDSSSAKLYKAEKMPHSIVKSQLTQSMDICSEDSEPNPIDSMNYPREVDQVDDIED